MDKEPSSCKMYLLLFYLRIKYIHFGVGQELVLTNFITVGMLHPQFSHLSIWAYNIYSSTYMSVDLLV